MLGFHWKSSFFHNIHLHILGPVASCLQVGKSRGFSRSFPQLIIWLEMQFRSILNLLNLQKDQFAIQEVNLVTSKDFGNDNMSVNYWFVK